MPKNLTVVIGADTSGLKKSIQEAKSSLESYAKAAKNSANQLNKTTTATKEQVASYKRSINALDKATSGAMSAEKAQKSLARQINNLKTQWSSLSAETRKSDFGKSMSNSITSAQSKLKQLQTQIGNTNNAVKNSAGAFSGIRNNILGLGSSATKAASGLGIFKAATTGLSTSFATVGTLATTASASLKGLGGSAALSSASLAAAGAAAVGIGNSIKGAGEFFLGSIKHAEEFNKALDTIKKNTNFSTEEYEYLEAAAADVADELNITATEALNLFHSMATLLPGLQKNAKAMVEVGKQSQILAQLTGIDLPEAQKVLAWSMSQFDLAVEDAADVVLMLAKAQKISTVDAKYFGEVIKIAGSYATKAGVDYDEFLSIVATIAPSFNDAGEAGKHLANVFNKLAEGPAKFNPEIVSMRTALDNLAKANLSAAQMADLVGEANVEMLKTMIDNRFAYSDTVDSINDLTSAEEQLKNQNASVGDSIQALKTSWANLQTEFGKTEFVQKIVGSFASIINAITETVKKLDVFFPAFQSFGEVIGETVLGAFHKMATNVLKIFNSLRDGLIRILANIISAFDSLIYKWQEVELDAKKVSKTIHLAMAQKAESMKFEASMAVDKTKFDDKKINALKWLENIDYKITEFLEDGGPGYKESHVNYQKEKDRQLEDNEKKRNERRTEFERKQAEEIAKLQEQSAKEREELEKKHAAARAKLFKLNEDEQLKAEEDVADALTDNAKRKMSEFGDEVEKAVKATGEVISDAVSDAAEKVADKVKKKVDEKLAEKGTSLADLKKKSKQPRTQSIPRKQYDKNDTVANNVISSSVRPASGTIKPSTHKSPSVLSTEYADESAARKAAIEAVANMGKRAKVEIDPKQSSSGPTTTSTPSSSTKPKVEVTVEDFPERPDVDVKTPDLERGKKRNPNFNGGPKYNPSNPQSTISDAPDFGDLGPEPQAPPKPQHNNGSRRKKKKMSGSGQGEFTQTGGSATVSNEQKKSVLDKTPPAPPKGGGFFGSLKDAAKAALPFATVAGAATMAIGVIKDGINVSMEFNKQMSTLKAVSGASEGELAKLRAQAEELGASTKYSASEIAGLQIELAKLGFKPDQISSMTDDIQNLATACNTDLSSAASLAGSTMRMFGLSAEDSGRIADVFAASTSKSALSFEYLDSAMSNVGPVAKAFGLTLEDTTGLLGVLSNAGFDASSAATAARNILLNLADANGDLAKAIGGPVKSGEELIDALKSLKDSGVDLATALELTNTESVAAFNTLLEGTDSAKALMKELYNCNGAAQDMSNIMSDNLDGDLAALKSAWEGLMISLGGGQSVIRLLVQGLTELVGCINTSVKAIIDWSKSFYEKTKAVCKAIVIIFGATFQAIVNNVKVAMNVLKAPIVILEKLLKGDAKGALDAFNSYFIKQFSDVKKQNKKIAKDIKDAWDEAANYDKKVHGPKVETTKHTTTTPSSPGKKYNVKLPKKTEEKTTTTTKTEVVYQEGSIGKLEKQIQDLQEKLKSATTGQLRKNIQREIDALQKKKDDMELELRPVLPEGSLALIDREINDLEEKLNLVIDDESRKKIQKELDELTGKKEIIELKLKPVVEDKDIEDLVESIEEHKLEMTAVIKEQKTEGVHHTKAEKAQTNADNLQAELDFSKSITRSYKDQYKEIQKKIAAGGQLNDNESKLAGIYERATRNVEELSKAYQSAANNALKLSTAANLKKKTWEGIKGGIDTIGSLNSSVQSVGSTWTDLSENWEDMSSFEKVTAGIGAVISTIQEVIGAYETVMSVIQLFADISAAASAKKIAADSSEMAMDSTKTATETANTQVKIANDTAEEASTLGKLGVDEAGAIASATASGASLPFPANIAAIAAGIAAVVAAFAMVFSCFADGGIVGGGSSVGDHNLARVNSGEMILNGTQQKKLFMLLNSGGIGPAISQSGNVNFRIQGKNLVGTLRNTNSRNSRI